MEIEEKFYHSRAFRFHRKSAAQELLRLREHSNQELERTGNSIPHIVEIFGFFEFVGVLWDEKALNLEMIRSSFYRRASAYRKAAQDVGLIDQWEESYGDYCLRYGKLFKALEKKQKRLNRKIFNLNDAWAMIEAEALVNVSFDIGTSPLETNESNTHTTDRIAETNENSN